MSGAFLSSVVHALRCNAGSAPMVTRPERELCTFSHREWMRRLGMLDRTGLTLPLYARLLANGDCWRLSAPTVVALEKRRRDNEIRMHGMLQTFGQAVGALQQTDVPFVCVKGFSLFPEFLEKPWQRHQLDFDLIVAQNDARRAASALEQLGYKLNAVAADGERRLRIPVMQALSHDAYVYQPQQGGAIELHSEVWESSGDQFPLNCARDVFEHAEMHTLGSVSFPRLSIEHAFLYQVLHLFRHFLGSWARPLWFYEIARFIDQHRNDDALWQRVNRLLLDDPRVAEAAAFVLLTADELFGCSIPTALERACALPDDSPIRLWIRHYARRWILTDMPGNKLNLLLQRHFFSDHLDWGRYLAGRLVPRGKRPVLCEGIEQKAAEGYQYRVANMRFHAARAWHHIHTDAGFAVASIAWGVHLRSLRSAAPLSGFARSQL